MSSHYSIHVSNAVQRMVGNSQAPGFAHLPLANALHSSTDCTLIAHVNRNHTAPSHTAAYLRHQLHMTSTAFFRRCRSFSAVFIFAWFIFTCIVAIDRRSSFCTHIIHLDFTYHSCRSSELSDRWWWRLVGVDGPTSPLTFDIFWPILTFPILWFDRLGSSRLRWPTCLAVESKYGHYCTWTWWW